MARLYLYRKVPRSALFRSSKLQPPLCCRFQHLQRLSLYNLTTTIIITLSMTLACTMYELGHWFLNVQCLDHLDSKFQHDIRRLFPS